MTTLCHGTLASASASALALQGVALALALESVALLTSLLSVAINNGSDATTITTVCTGKITFCML